MSDLMKIKRLVDGDNWFGGRVEAACWLHDVEYTPEVLKYVASQSAVLEGAVLKEIDAIYSEGITDKAIEDAIISYKEKLSE